MTAEGEAGTSPVPDGPVPDGGRHGDTRAAERAAEQLLSRVREDLGRADAKAAVLLSGTLALPAFLLGWHGAPGWHGPADVTLVAAAVLWAGAVIVLIGALMPRTRTVRARDGVTYFGDLVDSRDLAGLAAQIAEAARQPVEWLLVQAVDVSSILSAKYRATRWSMGLLALSAAVALAWGLTPR